MSIYAGRFEGRNAIITGGASGLGKQVAARIVAFSDDAGSDLLAKARRAAGDDRVAAFEKIGRASCRERV